jgi:hypothetical protein
MPLSDEQLERFSKKTVGAGIYGGPSDEAINKQISFPLKIGLVIGGFIFAFVLDVIFGIVSYLVPGFTFLINLVRLLLNPVVLFFGFFRRGKLLYFAIGLIIYWIIALILFVIIAALYVKSIGA